MQYFAEALGLGRGHGKIKVMSTIVPPMLDLEHWHIDKDTGPLTMFNAMQQTTNADAWADRSTSVDVLVGWWTRTSSYDPDLEPEGLINRSNLTPLSKEILGLAAAHRVRPRGLSWDIPTDDELSEWLLSSRAKTLRAALEIDSSGSWWNRCLFEGAKEQFHARTEVLVNALMHDHPFVHMATSLQLPLAQLLPMMDATPTVLVSTPEAPCLPDLC